MNDRILNSLREAPSPEFTRTLRARLDDEPESARSPVRRALWRIGAFATAAVVVIAAWIAFPPVRASAQAFLDLFRVRTFAAVPVSPERLARLDDPSLDLEHLIGDAVQDVKKPGEPQKVATVDEAGSRAGLTVLQPGFVPGNLALEAIAVGGEGEARITASGDRLRRIADALEVRDVTIPAGLDGQVLTVRTAPTVHLRYGPEDRGIHLLEARSPEITLPHDVDLAQLGEIGLRLAGLSATDAKRFAESIDWRSTLLVPVPANASSFREVTVRGERGLMVTMSVTRKDGQRREGTMVMWSEGDRVFALRSARQSQELLTMANSLR